MISRGLPAQNTTAAPACPNFSHGNAGKICPSSGNTLMTSLQKHRLAAFVHENKKAQLSQLANSSNNSNSGLGWYFFPQTVVEYLRNTKAVFLAETQPCCWPGEGGHSQPRVPEGKELHPSSASSQFLPFSITWLPRHSSFHILACPQKAAQLLEGGKLCLAASSCEVECQNRWEGSGGQWRQSLAG